LIYFTLSGDATGHTCLFLVVEVLLDSTEHVLHLFKSILKLILSLIANIVALHTLILIIKTIEVLLLIILLLLLSLELRLSICNTIHISAASMTMHRFLLNTIDFSRMINQACARLAVWQPTGIEILHKVGAIAA